MILIACSVIPARASLHELRVEVDDPYVPPYEESWNEVPVHKAARAPGPTPYTAGPIQHARRQPAGALSNLIVFVSAGHGFVAHNSAWIVQRPLLHAMVEDMGNLDQMNLFAQYVFNAGGTVVPFRPLGYQTNEVVLDNVDAGVTWAGTWYNSSSPIFFGNTNETPYRYAYISTNSETAVATYRPNIPARGEYPVYAWTRRGTDRVRQLYRIHHHGGVSEVRINHRRVGSGWVWLGNYFFESGTNGYVEISNHAPGHYNPASNVIIADAIRFGNGMGNINRGFGVSGHPRELEASRYWVQHGTGQGMDPGLYDRPTLDDWDDNVGAPARMANYMNDATDGGYWDRIYLGFHSNAGSGSSRGSMGLHSTANPEWKQDEQKAYGKALTDAIDAAMTWGGGGKLFIDTWGNNSANQYGASYGEISHDVNGNMNSTIIEVGFHDNADDARLLRDPAARLTLARACYKGLVKHLNDNNPANVPYQLLPDPPTNVVARNDGPGNVTVSWMAPSTNPASGHAATGYVVYRSAAGDGFGNAVEISGGSTTSHTFTSLGGGTWYFRISAVNAGGESLPSEAVGVAMAPAGHAPHLVVNGFMRFDRNLSPTRYFANNINGNVTLVRPKHINRFDYIVPHGAVVRDAKQRFFDSCAHAAVISGAVSLTNYHAAYWILGEESTANETFSSTEQTLVAAFLNQGRCLFVSGAELAWDLGNLGSTADRLFLTNILRVAYGRDGAGTNRVTGVAGSIFDGLGPMDFDANGSMHYSVEWPDVFVPQHGAVSALKYGPSAAGPDVAAIQYSNNYRLVVMGFPFETLLNAQQQRDLMARVLDFFGDAPGYDGDADGMADDWEREHFAGGIDADPDRDDDEDGMIAREEYVAGTNPNNAASLLEAYTVTRPGGQFVLEWPSVAGRLYSIYSTTNAASGLAAVPGASNLSATPPLNSWTNTLAVDSLRLFRVRVDLP